MRFHCACFYSRFCAFRLLLGPSLLLRLPGAARSAKVTPPLLPVGKPMFLSMPMWAQQLLLVMCGGALGAAGRHWMNGYLLRRIGEGIPWGTLAVNLIGSFAVGFLAIWLEGRGPSALYWRAFLIVGLLGGLTTYSSLMLESLLYVRTDRTAVWFCYLAVTLVAGLALVWLGSRLAVLLRPVW